MKNYSISNTLDRNQYLRPVRTVLALMGAVFSLTLSAAEVTVELDIPDITIAEYHRPYVAVWIENDKRRPVEQIALWLEQEKWHRDLRSWWRRGGSKLALPVDGVSGATRKPGSYTVTAALELPAGSYSLNVEAVREVGGRELVRIPFNWSGQRLQISEHGATELGNINLIIDPEN